MVFLRRTIPLVACKRISASAFSERIMSMINTSGCRLSVSTWSLHRTLGRPDIYGVEAGFHIPSATHGRGALSLLELPARLATFGIHTLELCHFHLPSLDPGYLTELHSELTAAQVELFSLLIDDGDIVHATYADRDLAWIRRWIEIAGTLGARCTRVIAGKSAPTPISQVPIR